jgi:hypothetical protein
VHLHPGFLQPIQQRLDAVEQAVVRLHHPNKRVAVDGAAVAKKTRQQRFLADFPPFELEPCGRVLGFQQVAEGHAEVARHGLVKGVGDEGVHDVEEEDGLLWLARGGGGAVGVGGLGGARALGGDGRRAHPAREGRDGAGGDGGTPGRRAAAERRCSPHAPLAFPLWPRVREVSVVGERAPFLWLSRALRRQKRMQSRVGRETEERVVW